MTVALALPTRPSQHALVLAGAIVAAVLLTSVAVVRRDAWIPAAHRHRKLLARAALGGAVAVGAGVLIAHREALADVLHRVEQGNPWWLLAAAACETVSFAGYMVLTHAVYSPRAPRLGWAASVELTLAGVVATRILSAGGAGGIAFTGWALHRAGMSARDAARRLSAFLVLLYSVYIAALLLGGTLVVLGLLGEVPAALGWVGIGVGGIVTAAVVLIVRVPGDLEHRALRLAEGRGRLGGVAAKLAPAPQVAGTAVRLAATLARERPAIMVGPLLWWSADIATLWAAFHAFGEPPATGTLVLCYFLGQLGNLLPLPGGVGGTEGGMVGAFAASGVDAGLALLAVLAYQLISTYLPALPGLGAYLSLRRRMRAWGDPADEPDAAATAAA